MKAGKAHEMSLGTYPEVALSDARRKALDTRRMVQDGGDPFEAKRHQRDQQAHTFEAVARECIESMKPSWDNPKHAKQWDSTLETYAYPVIGQKPVQAITTDHILEILTPIWETKTETASRVRGRIETVLNYAKARKWRTGENPAAWRGHLDSLLPKPSAITPVEHHPAVPWAELPPVMAKLESSETMSATCLRFAVLTAVRSNEVRAARWNEIDLEKRNWTVTAARMKGKKTKKKSHCVPLSDSAVDILQQLLPLKKSEEDYIFPGGKPGGKLSDVILSDRLAEAYEGVTVHGMRSSFRDWAAEIGRYPREVAEAALAHVNKDKTEAAYLRTDFLEQRRPLMQDWANFLKTKIEKL
jgi:integrase